MAFAAPPALRPSPSSLRLASAPRRRLRHPRTPAAPPPLMVSSIPGSETVPSTAGAGDASPSLPDAADVVVIGAGPAGLSLARALGERGVRVVCVDPALHTAWPNNYGTWVDELEPLGLGDCVSRVWEKTSVHVRGDGRKTRLDRAYARVDRHRLKRRLLQLCGASGRVTVAAAAAQAVDTESSARESVVRLDSGAVRARVVVDATGHALRFVRLAGDARPGFQAAYGVEVELADDLAAFDPDHMELMDYRADHMRAPRDAAAAHTHPTFLYVMPMTRRRVFFEETSLVASPPMPFDELKRRLHLRLAHHGVRVARVLDEELCLIPMGGALPSAAQRVVAYGGAAAHVHPATGYMIARALTLAGSTADGIARALRTGAHLDADALARRVWAHAWNRRMLSQRDFLTYGGSYLQKIDLAKTRDFFSAFFRLPTPLWADFLSFRLDSPLERLLFGLAVFFHTSNAVRSSLVLDSVLHGGSPFFFSLLPLAFAPHQLPDSREH